MLFSFIYYSNITDEKTRINRLCREERNACVSVLLQIQCFVKLCIFVKQVDRNYILL